MRPAGEGRQRLRPFIEIARLVKNPTIDGERLIGANAVSVRPLRADCESLRPRQFDSDIFNRAALSKIKLFERTLVDLRRDRLSVQSCGRQERAAAFAPRRQNQASSAAPQRRQGGRLHEGQPLAMN